jgi:hypothetical protein
LKTKIRKLQKENRDLRAQLIVKIKQIHSDVNAPIVSTDVDSKGESTTEADQEEVEITAPIKGEN